MKFSIITPTYKRADKLPRAIESVLKQSHADWEMIIVNDSPDDANYASFEKNISDPRVIYLKNEKNEGVNYSRNRALDSLSKDSDWVIFLDDDDYFTPDTLENFKMLISTHLKKHWFITNRAYKNGSSLTKFPKTDSEYAYIKDYLILKRGTGDVTHCIASSLLKNIRFPKQTKQAEEWLFFYQLGSRKKMFYHNHDSTLTDGYSETTGLNFRKDSPREQLKTLLGLIKEGHALHLSSHPTFILYLFMRFFRLGLQVCSIHR